MSFDFTKGETVKESNVPKENEDSIIKKASDAIEKYFLKPASKFTGIQSAVNYIGKQGQRIGEAGAYAMDKNVREQTQTPEGVKEILPNSADLIDKPVGDVAKQIGGEALETASETAPWFLAGAGKGSGMYKQALKFGTAGGAISSGKELAKQLEDDNFDLSKIYKEAGKGFFTSALFSIATSKMSDFFQGRATRKYGATFNASKRNVSHDIQRDLDTINTKMSKEGYVGTATHIKNKAKANMSTYGKKVRDKIANNKDVVLRGTIAKPFEKMLQENDTLTDAEISLLLKQFKRMPKQMSVPEANYWKMNFAKKVTPSSWTSPLGKADTFRNEMYKTLSGELRRQIEKAVPESRGLNEKWAIALDTRNLSSDYLAGEELINGFGDNLKNGNFIKAFMSLPILKEISSPASRTIRGQIDQGLANLTKNELVQRLSRYMWLEHNKEDNK